MMGMPPFYARQEQGRAGQTETAGMANEQSGDRHARSAEDAGRVPARGTWHLGL